MRVYKFLSDNFALDNLAKRRINISQYNEMNDPFELRGVTPSGPRTFDFLQTFLNDYCGALCFTRTWNNSMLWSHYGDKHRGICLGFDIVAPAKLQEPIFLEKPVIEVFGDTVIELAAMESIASDCTRKSLHFDAVNGLITKMLLSKSTQWRYENEIRLLLQLKEDQRDGPFYFAEFDEMITPIEVVTGPRCSVPLAQIESEVRVSPV